MLYSNKKRWDDLHKDLLLGVVRASHNPKQSDQYTPERSLLARAAKFKIQAEVTYELTAHAHLSPISPAPQERCPIFQPSVNFHQTLELILQEPKKTRMMLLAIYFSVLHRRGLVLPYQQLTSVIEAYRQALKFSSIKEGEHATHFWSVIGERGRWLMHNHSPWKKTLLVEIEQHLNEYIKLKEELITREREMREREMREREMRERELSLTLEVQSSLQALINSMITDLDQCALDREFIDRFIEDLLIDPQDTLAFTMFLRHTYPSPDERVDLLRSIQPQLCFQPENNPNTYLLFELMINTGLTWSHEIGWSALVYISARYLFELQQQKKFKRAVQWLEEIFPRLPAEVWTQISVDFHPPPNSSFNKKYLRLKSFNEIKAQIEDAVVLS